MDFLTTNFDEELDYNFTDHFKILELPLEILLKVFIFLDIPDLQNIGLTCKYLRIIANERFISRSRFFYIQQKIGISMELRPSFKNLNERNIIPNSINYENFNLNRFLLINNLEKSFKQDNLTKNLIKRPSKEELKRINILPTNEMSPKVKDKVKEFQKQNISNMLDVLLKSYKYQIKNSDIKEVNNQPVKLKLDDLKQELETSASSSSNGTIEVSDDFTKAYMSFFEKVHKINGKSVSPSKSKDISLRQVLNHIDKNEALILKREGNITSEINEINELNDSKNDKSNVVKLRRQYFENLEMMENSPQSSPIKRSISETDRLKGGTSRKPSRTVLKASIIDDSIISYEKMF